jgi:uncharacterized protein YneF (UPF0154 family)
MTFAFTLKQVDLAVLIGLVFIVGFVLGMFIERKWK